MQIGHIEIVADTSSISVSIAILVSVYDTSDGRPNRALTPSE
jgi:hypothetical protein